MAKRVFLIVLDSFGIGSCEDSAEFGDEGANTLASIYKSDYFCAPNLAKMGLFNIDGVEVGKKQEPIGAHARLRELSKGKDTTIGHWEIAGIVSNEPLPTYPNGFPKELLDEFSRRAGRGVLCNKPYSGTKVIDDYGDEHVKTGDLIVYTSADSIFQIAAHEDIVPLDTLYEYCRIARNILQGKHGVGRVIARPFAGESGKYYRTSGRHDYSLEPSETTLLEELSSAGLDVISVGKINDIFCGRGVTKHYATSSNKNGMETVLQIAKTEFNGLCFVNLVDFDMVYGHRRDVDGYARAISEFDEWLGSFIQQMRSDDVVMITADHGCDPAYTKTTDHTREFVPLLIYTSDIKPIDLGTKDGFCTVGKTVAEMLGINADIDGISIIDSICK